MRHRLAAILFALCLFVPLNGEDALSPAARVYIDDAVK